MTNYITHLYRAASTPRGIVVASEDVPRLRTRLYAVMQKHPEFSNLSLIPNPLNPGELFILNKDPINEGTGPDPEAHS